VCFFFATKCVALPLAITAADGLQLRVPDTGALDRAVFVAFPVF
jgi:hypothetical protein